MRLFIIGNGFDLAHNLKTSYADFGEYLEKNDNNFYKELIDIYGGNDLWSNFEKALGEPNIKFINRLNKLFCKKVIGENFAKELKDKIGKWICFIKYNSFEKKFDCREDDLYFSFNYTNTLGEIYGIKDSQILFIHKFVADAKLGAELIVGHNNKDFKGNELIEKTYKNVEKIISKNHEWFENLKKKQIEEIEVIGHSYNEIDFPYFKAIREVLSSVNWKFNYYSKEDFINLNNYISKLNLNKDKRYGISKLT